MNADNAGSSHARPAAQSPAASPPKMSRDEIARRIGELGPWFHNMDLGGVATAPDHFLGDYPRVKFAGFTHAFPKDLHGASVLDIGCNAGFYSLEMKQRGAGHVVGIDTDARYLAQARFAAELCGFPDIRFHQMDVYDVAKLGDRFDLVIFMGVFYHLRHPLLALDLIHEHVAGDLLMFQSLQRGSEETPALAEDYSFTDEAVFDQPGWPKLHIVERSYCGDWTNWFVPNAAGAQALLRASGFDVVEKIEQEVYLCRRRELPPDRGPYAAYPARGIGG